MGLLTDVRAQVILSFVFLVLLGLPVWWKTTETYRAQLPHTQIQSSNHLILLEKPWKIFVDIIVITDEKDDKFNYQEASSVKRHLATELAQLSQQLAQPSTKSTKLPPSFVPEFEVSLSLKQLPALTQSLGKVLPSLDALDDWLFETVLQRTSNNGRYHFFLIPSDKEAKDAQTILGKYRHGFQFVNSNGDNLQPVATNIAQTIQTNILPNHDPQKILTELTAVRPSPSYRISFNLLNVDPASYQPSWDISGALQKYLHPLLASLSDLAEFTVDAQILHYASLLKAPNFDSENKLYYLDANSLTSFINPTEIKLDFTETTTQPLLNFILLVPAAYQEPLHIRLADGSLSSTNGFVTPQWGGVAILSNPKSFISTPAIADTGKAKGKATTRITLSAADLHPYMEIFAEQLRELLGLSPIDSNIIPSKKNGISQWELDKLTRRNLFYNVNSTISTLKSLSNLVQNLTNMVVLDNIQQLCVTALDSLNKAEDYFLQGDYDQAFAHSKTAVRASEEAFFDPNMLSLLYFPDEHKYAVYALPFFPITFQLLSGIYTEIKSRRSANKRKLKSE